MLQRQTLQERVGLRGVPLRPHAGIETGSTTSTTDAPISIHFTKCWAC